MTAKGGRAPFHYGWIVISTAFIALLCTAGVRYSLSPMIRPWESEMGWTRDMVSLVGSLALIVWGVLPPIAGRLADQLGSRMVLFSSVLLAGLAALLTSFVVEFWQLLLTFGVLAGVGAALGSPVTASPLAARWFQKKRGLAIGIVSAGISGAQTIIIPAVIFLIVSSGWRTAMFWVGLGLIFVLAPAVYLLLRSSPAEMGLKPYGASSDAKVAAQAMADDERHTSIADAMRTRPFWLMSLGFFVCGFTTLGLITTHIVPYTTGDLRLNETNAAQALAVLGIFDVTGTILAGYLSDRFGRAFPLGMTYLIRAISYLVLLNAGSPELLLLWSVIFGVTDLATVPLVAALTGDIYGRRSMGTIYGSIFLVHQIGAAVGAAFGGFVFQAFGTYQPAMVTGFVLLLAASAMSFLIREQRHAPAAKPKPAT